MTQPQLKQFFKSLRQPGWAVIIFFNVVLLCLAFAFVALIFTQSLIWNTRQTAVPATSQISVPANLVPVVAVKTSEYVVKTGDSLWNVAVKTYGDGERYSDIAAVNHLADPDQLTVGQRLELPAQSELLVPARPAESETSLLPATPEPPMEETPTARYTVKAGDTLWQIAQTQLHSPYQWSRVYALNRGVIGQNPDLIYPGQQLVVPVPTSAQK
jgi:nucleoid-associated protein YgaU